MGLPLDGGESEGRFRRWRSFVQSWITDRPGILRKSPRFAKESLKLFNIGLFILGVAHLHSTLSKLKTAGFEVPDYSWMEH